jgi:hypothetical protein
MRTQIASVLGLGFLSLCAQGCLAMPTQAPVTGIIYSDVQGHSNATSNVVGSKRGEACAMSILGLVALGDASANTAAQAGGITKIGVVDTDMFGVLGLFAKHCTVVRGE